MDINRRIANLENRSIVNFASVSNTARNIEDGNIKIELSPSQNNIYFTSKQKSISDSIRMDVINNEISEVNKINFTDGSKITGVTSEPGDDPTKALSTLAVKKIDEKIDKVEKNANERIDGVNNRVNSKFNEIDISIMEHTQQIDSMSYFLSDVTNTTNRLETNVMEIESNLNYKADINHKHSEYALKTDIPKIDRDPFVATSVQIGSDDNKYALYKYGYNDLLKEWAVHIGTNAINDLIAMSNSSINIKPRLYVQGYDYKHHVYPVGCILCNYTMSFGTWDVCQYIDRIGLIKHNLVHVYLNRDWSGIEVKVWWSDTANKERNIKILKSKWANDGEAMIKWNPRFTRQDYSLVYGYMSEQPRATWAKPTIKIDLNYGSSTKRQASFSFKLPTIPNDVMNGQTLKEAYDSLIAVDDISFTNNDSMEYECYATYYQRTG